MRLTDPADAAGGFTSAPEKMNPNERIVYPFQQADQQNFIEFDGACREINQ
ncbi:hypothetical protein [Mucilaginibacter mallensis]|uniref:hypothetical protein n=1 Tax=Mucilaginibacter mallensis TaxID=652787 RepID=UPI0012FCEA69|nr:hypothetical protein [Mucilaginibacter mallensis]